MKTYTGSLGFQTPTLRLFNFLYVLLFLCKEIATHEEDFNFSDFLLCKFCGSDVADLNYILTIKSPASVKEDNQTFSGRQVLVQTVKNPSNFYHDIITVRKSACVGYGQWSKAGTWFPGYAWKLCICQPQGHFLGWFPLCLLLYKSNRPKEFSNRSKTMTEDQEKFLKELEEEFKDRYTEKDEDYKASLKEESTVPPVVENWISMRPPRHEYHNRNDRYNRNEGNRRHNYKFVVRDRYYDSSHPY